MSLADVEEFVAAEIEEKLFATGGQLYVSVEGEVVLDLALGVDALGRPVDPGSLFAVYCMGKPILATAVGCLVDEGEISFDDRLGDVVESGLPGHLQGMTIGQLLDHTSGLHGLHTYELFGAPARRHVDLVAGVVPPPGWRVGEDVAYCAVVPWELLGWAVESLTGRPCREYVAKAVLGPADLDQDVFVAGMGEVDFARHRERLGVNAYVMGTEVTPILVEQSARYRCLASPAAGTTASARGLGRFFEHLLAVRHGGDGVVSPGTAQTLLTPRSHGFDPVMGRECGYSLGFMIRLSQHDFGRWCSTSSFGHSAYGGMSAAFCDPEHDLVVAFHFNARVDAETAVMYRRPALLERLYRVLIEERQEQLGTSA